MKVVGYVVSILLIIGGLNWGFVGLFDFDVIARAFGDMSMLTRLVYVLVGVAGLYELYRLFATK